MNAAYHIPVLLEESLEGLNIHPEGTYVDVTYGGGGHSAAILKRLTTGRLIAFDRDPDARANKIEDERLHLVASDFKFFVAQLAQLEIHAVDGILGDLGISSHQIDTPERGFSHRFDGPLDMRMNPRRGLTAAEVLNTWDEGELNRVFRRYGEVPNAKKLARVITEQRSAGKLERTKQFETAILSCLPPRQQAKYLSQVYQALRIVVNEEMEALEALLTGSLGMLKTGGRLVVIAYHSLEDRLVKHFMRSGHLDGKEEKDFYGRSLSPWKKVTRRAIQASEAETNRNPRARSARLRVAEKIEVPTGKTGP